MILPRVRSAPLAVLLGLAAFACPLQAADSVYRWVDGEGVIHISSEKPPPGVKAERIEVRGSSSRGSGGSTRSSTPQSAATPAQVAGREEVLGSLRNRECVIALESLDRLTSGTAPTSATELRRLQQTVDLNCSRDPAQRQQQEEMAARLRVSNSPACVDARNKLATMLEPGARVTREQLKAQQDFVAGHCTAPVR